VKRQGGAFFFLAATMVRLGRCHHHGNRTATKTIRGGDFIGRKNFHPSPPCRVAEFLHELAHG